MTIASLVISGAAIVITAINFYLHWRWRDDVH